MRLKHLIRRYLPEPNRVTNNRYLKWLGPLTQRAYLWHLNRRTLRRAMAIGLFIAFIPLPGHMVLAAILAISCRANLLVAIAAVWFSNPITMIPLYYLGYKLGAYVLQLPIYHINFTMTLTFFKSLGTLALPLFLGCLLAGLLAALLANIASRLFWRYHVVSAWRNRH